LSCRCAPAVKYGLSVEGLAAATANVNGPPALKPVSETSLRR
jgi:hypothetical protein